jgi:nucleoside phosphorylase
MPRNRIHVVDVAILIPLEEELKYLADAFPLVVTNRSFAAPSDARILYTWLEIPGTDLRVAARTLPRMGNTFSVDAVRTFVQDLNPSLVVCIGIAGSVSADLRIGDVAIANRVTDIANAAKIKDQPRSEDQDSSDELVVKLVSHPFTPDPQVLAHISRWTRSEGYLSWQAKRNECFPTLITFASEAKQEKFAGFFRATPTAQFASFATGFVLASQLLQDKLPARDDKVVETEGAGVGLACYSTGVPFLVVRGVSDLADAAKSGLEKEFGNANRKLALFNAFSCFLSFAQESWFSEWLFARQPPAGTKGLVSFGFCNVSTMLRDKAFQVAREIDLALRNSDTSSSSYAVQVEHAPAFWRIFPSLTPHPSLPKEDIAAALEVLRSYAVWSSMLGDIESADAIAQKLDAFIRMHGASLPVNQRAWCEGVHSHILLRAGRLPEAATTARRGLRYLREAIEQEGPDGKARPECKSLDAQLLLSQKCLHCMSAELLDEDGKHLGYAMIEDVNRLKEKRRSLEPVPDRSLPHDEFFFEMVQAKIALHVRDGSAAERHVQKAREAAGTYQSRGTEPNTVGKVGRWREDVDLELEICELYGILASTSSTVRTSIEQPARLLVDAIRGRHGSGHCWLRLQPDIRAKLGIQFPDE